MTDVQICNVALSTLGLKTITSLTSDQREATACALHYPLSVQEVLSEHTWTFALGREILSVVVDEAYPNEYEFLYALPGDCLRVVGLYDESWKPVTGYRVEARRIATDTEAVRLSYVRSITNPMLFSPHFANAVAMLVASKIAVEFKQARQLMQDAMQRYIMALERGRQIDTQQREGVAAPVAGILWENTF
jgi:hypothetical protein